MNVSWFNDVFQTVKEQTPLKRGINPHTNVPFQWYDDIAKISRMATQVQTNNSFTVSAHLKEVIYSLLSCQRPWSKLEEHIAKNPNHPDLDDPSMQKGKRFPHLDIVFEDYDPDRLKAANVDDILNKVHQIDCGNRRINWQIPALLNQTYYIPHTHPKSKVVTNHRHQGNIISVLEMLHGNPTYAFLDFKHGYRSFVLDENGNPRKERIFDLVALLSGGKVSTNFKNQWGLSDEDIKKCAMEEMGAALVCEYIKGFGINIVKPDTHVCRVLARMGCIQKETDIQEALKVCDNIANHYKGMINNELNGTGVTVDPAIAVDTVLWQFAAQGRLEICNKNSPKCTLCRAKTSCHYYNPQQSFKENTEQSNQSGDTKMENDRIKVISSKTRNVHNGTKEEITVLQDVKTGIHYLKVASFAHQSMGGVCVIPLLNADGKPYISAVEEEK